jgi:hypothetical protein
MALKFEVDEGPEVAVAPQDDIAAPSAVAAVGTPESDELFPAKMGTSRSARSRAAENLDVIYKIAV